MMNTHERKKVNMKAIGRFCKHFRINYLGLNLKEFSERANLNNKSVSAFEHGNANSIHYLYHYYHQATDEAKEVFSSNIFEITKE